MLNYSARLFLLTIEMFFRLLTLLANKRVIKFLEGVKEMKKSLILVSVITLLVALSSVAFAQNSKKKSKTPPATATGAKTASKPSTTTNLSGGDDPEGNTQRSSKASKSTTPPKTASLAQGTFDPGVAKKTTDLSGGDDPQEITQKSSKAPGTTNSKAKNAEFATFPSSVVDTKSKKTPTNQRKSKTPGLVADTPAEVTKKPIINTDTQKAKTPKKTTNLSGVDDADGIQPQTKTEFYNGQQSDEDGIQPQTLNANKKTDNFDWEADESGLKTQPLKVIKKTDNFQTTSEDLQSLKATKKTTNLGGGDDPIGNTQRSSKANQSKAKSSKVKKGATVKKATPKRP